jgi:hypothetical protein
MLFVDEPMTKYADEVADDAVQLVNVLLETVRVLLLTTVSPDTRLSN